MRKGILSCAIVSVLLAGPALAQAPSQEDAIQAELENLREQTKKLQAQLQALQAARTKANREVAEKYMRELADSCLDAILKGDPEAIIPVLSKEIKDRYLGNDKNQIALANYTRGLGLGPRGIEVSSFKITSVTVAPTHEEAIFRGQIAGKAVAGNELGKEKEATFALQIYKEKESGRFVIGFVSVK